MADENNNSPLGTDALRRVVESSRAQAGAFNGPPPDPLATPPWMNQPPLPPPAQPTPKPAAPPRRKSEVVTLKPRVRQGLAEVPLDKHENAWQLAHRILQQYGTEIEKNLGRADLHLAQELMKNGTLLLRFGVPMDNLGTLIRLARDLAHQSSVDAPDDPRIEALRVSMERNESTIPPLAREPDDDEGEDDGE